MRRITQLLARLEKLKPVRVFRHFSDRRGFLLAAGLSYHSIFAVFAAAWVGFAIGGLVLRGNERLSDAFFTLINTSVPGLLAWDGAEGIIDPESLLEIQALGITGAIAVVALTFTAVGWLSSARDAVRALFDLPGQQVNPVLLKLKDFALGLGFGLTLLVSAALTVAGTQTLNTILGWFGIAEQSWLATTAASAAFLSFMVILDTVVLAMLFRVLSGLDIPRWRLRRGAFFGAVGLGTLKVLGTVVLSGASRNPLLASFAIFIGLLIWFNLVCTVILGAATWIAVGMDDEGLVADPAVAAQREEAARKQRERIAAQLLSEREAELGFFRRLALRIFGRPRHKDGAGRGPGSDGGPR